MNPCPNCGYCPTCGRRWAQPYPIYPSPIWITPVQPWQSPFINTPSITSGGMIGNGGYGRSGTLQ